jgi:Phage integrase family
MNARTIELEKKSAQALKTYIAHRPQTFDQHVFLNRYGEPISERGIRKLVAKYVRAGGITKKASCHSLRHTFATYKAEHGVSPYQLQPGLGTRAWRPHSFMSTSGGKMPGRSWRRRAYETPTCIADITQTVQCGRNDYSS